MPPAEPSRPDRSLTTGTRVRATAAGVGVLFALAGCGGSDPAPPGAIETDTPPARAPVIPSLAPELLPAMELVGDQHFAQAAQIIDTYERGAAPVAYHVAFLRGFIEQKRKAYASARRHFEQAIELHPDYHPSWHFLGFAAYSLGDLDGAQAAFEEHARLAPGEGDDAFGLGLVAFERHELSAAERHFREALALHQQAAVDGADRGHELAKCRARLADVHGLRGDWAAARDELEAAVQTFTGSDEIWHKLAAAHRRLGDEERAAEATAIRDRVRELTAARGR